MDKKERIQRNKRLCKEYPFLVPRNAWSGRVVNDYDYSYTEMDAMPQGWGIAFGDLLIHDLKKELEKHYYLYRFRILDLKEKYGELRLYHNGVPQACRGEDIITAYSILSQNICICCGKPNVPMITGGWISPFCENCYSENDSAELKTIKKAEWEKCSKQQYPHKLATKYTCRQMDQDGNIKEYEVDITSYAKRIEEAYLKRTMESSKW